MTLRPRARCVCVSCLGVKVRCQESGVRVSGLGFRCTAAGRGYPNASLHDSASNAKKDLLSDPPLPLFHGAGLEHFVFR